MANSRRLGGRKGAYAPGRVLQGGFGFLTRLYRSGGGGSGQAVRQLGHGNGAIMLTGQISHGAGAFTAIKTGTATAAFMKIVEVRRLLRTVLSVTASFGDDGNALEKVAQNGRHRIVGDVVADAGFHRKLRVQVNLPLYSNALDNHSQLKFGILSTKEAGQ